jgi:hypothetical protein
MDTHNLLGLLSILAMRRKYGHPLSVRLTVYVGHEKGVWIPITC